MKQLGEYKCRICERQHTKLSDLIAHLNTTHVHQEMPYRCDACGFRTSFYADAIYHIKKEHKSTLRHFCPYCLKSLALPFNEKLGYAQCNLFYAHLITHFNKHENDILMPSKCKHCQKCILHIRYMKEHLTSDHSSNVVKPAVTNAPTITKIQTPNLNEAKIKKETSSPISKVKPQIQEIATITKETSQKLDKGIKKAINEGIAAVDVNLKKRRRSNEQIEVKIECDDEPMLIEPVPEVKEKHFEFEDQDDIIDLNESKKLMPKIKTKRTFSSISITRTTKVNSPAESLSKKTHFPSISIDNEFLPLNPTYRRRQTALKQTNVKRLPGHIRSRPITLDDPFFSVGHRSRSSSSSNDSFEVINAVLSGNVKFTYIKNQFKCAECESNDLRTHFK